MINNFDKKFYFLMIDTINLYKVIFLIFAIHYKNIQGISNNKSCLIKMIKRVISVYKDY